jgi:hypothetical protein
MRTARIAGADKFGRAIEFAEITKAMTAKYPEAKKIDVFMDLVGDSGNMRWIVDYPDLATFEKVSDAIRKDADYWKLMGAYSDVFIQDTLEDVLLKQI